MSSVETTYLGWTEPAHYEGCARPRWEVDYRTEYDVFRGRHGGPEHQCPNESCGHHGDRYDRTTIRLVCRSCARTYTLSAHASGLYSAGNLGIGQPPLKKAGLWLWPGEPLLRLKGNEPPASFLATRDRVERVQREDVVGAMSWGLTHRGRDIWSAVAVPNTEGPYGYGEIRWAKGAQELRSLAAAAKWIAGQYAEAGGPA